MTIPDTAHLHADTLATYLKRRLSHRRLDALKRLAEVLLALIQAGSTLHRKIALHLPRDATLDAKTRTVARVFHDAHLTPQDVCDVLLSLLPDGKLTLIMDRTTWHYGQTPLNILVLGALLGGAVPQGKTTAGEPWSVRYGSGDRSWVKPHDGAVRSSGTAWSCSAGLSQPPARQLPEVSGAEDRERDQGRHAVSRPRAPSYAFQ